MNPKISIITPSYNQGQFLEETIRSVLDQGYPNLEYIVMDGGSTDNSVKIIKKYQNRLTYWVSEPDKGQSDAINKGFRMATGDIVTWLNSDDYYLPGTLQTVATFFMEHPDVECVYGDQHIVDKNSNLLYVGKAIPYNYRTMLFGGARVPQPSSFYRRSVVDRVGYLDTTLHYNMDVEYFIRFGKYGIHFAHIPHPLTCFRAHIDSKAQDVRKIAHTNRRIMTIYTGRFSKNEWLHNAILDLLHGLYRIKAFTTRAITRGDIVPFRTRWARWKARQVGTD